jgi:hypothetical protein
MRTKVEKRKSELGGDTHNGANQKTFVGLHYLWILMFVIISH